MDVLPVSGTAFVLYDGPEHPETKPSHFSQKKSRKPRNPHPTRGRDRAERPSARLGYPYGMADQRFRRPSVRLAIPVVALVLASCGGSEEPAAEEPAVEAEAAVTTTAAPAPTTTEAPATTEAPTTTVAEVNYAAAVVVVANASSVNGSAGRMSDILSAAGYTMGSATNSTEGQLGATKVYYATGDDAAQAVAESIVRLLGGAIEMLQLPGVPPVESASLDGATVLIALGDDWADRNPTAATGG